MSNSYEPWEIPQYGWASNESVYFDEAQSPYTIDEDDGSMSFKGWILVCMHIEFIS